MFNWKSPIHCWFPTSSQIVLWKAHKPGSRVCIFKPNKNNYHKIILILWFLSIPNSTSPHLKDLLYKLLKRNPTDRINFEDFSTHKFLCQPKVEEKAQEMSSSLNAKIQNLLANEPTALNNNKSNSPSQSSAPLLPPSENRIEKNNSQDSEILSKKIILSSSITSITCRLIVLYQRR